MRVITGIAKGRRLETPEGLETRPTTQKVKEAIFSAIQFDIAGTDVLDLFCGSGQLGIEALSRGAKSATFVDNNTTAINIVRKNLDTTKLSDNAEVFKLDAMQYIDMTSKMFDFVFLDPPYKTDEMPNYIKKLSKVVKTGGKVLAEMDSEKEIDYDELGEFTLYKKYKYGRVLVTVFEKG